jgi:hypothetical protein
MLIVFSASGCWTDFYTLGVLKANLDANPLEAKSWTKIDHPFLSTDPSSGVFAQDTTASSNLPMVGRTGLSITLIRSLETAATIFAHRVSSASPGISTARELRSTGVSGSAAGETRTLNAAYLPPSSSTPRAANSVAQTIRRTKVRDAQTLKVLKNQISHNQRLTRMADGKASTAFESTPSGEFVFFFWRRPPAKYLGRIRARRRGRRGDLFPTQTKSAVMKKSGSLKAENELHHPIYLAVYPSQRAIAPRDGKSTVAYP